MRTRAGYSCRGARSRGCSEVGRTVEVVQETRRKRSTPQGGRGRVCGLLSGSATSTCGLEVLFEEVCTAFSRTQFHGSLTDRTECRLTSQLDRNILVSEILNAEHDARTRHSVCESITIRATSGLRRCRSVR